MAHTHSKVSKAKARLLMDHPFFACLLLRTPVVVCKETSYGAPVQLAATDGTNIYINDEFLEKLTVEETMSVLAHEVGHDSLLHSLRLGARNPDMFNIAADHAINLVLEDQKFSPPKATGWLADPQYKGWSADRIYDDLRRKQPPEQPKSGKGGAGQPSGKGGKGPDKDWLHGDILRAPAKDDAAQAQAEQRAKQRVAAAANMARLAGNFSGELARIVGEFLEGKVDWTELLREYMLRVIKSRDNWSRRNRRFNDVYLPTRKSLAMGPICFIPDTSGSMMGDDMEKICSEMAHCATETQPENIRVVWADAVVAGEQVFEPSDFSYAALEPVGGGGTDMRVPLKHVEQYDPQVVVLMTDGYTPWPDEECPYPVICICTTDAKVPYWMECIRI